MAYFINSELSIQTTIVPSRRIRGTITEEKIRTHYAASSKRQWDIRYVAVCSARRNISLQSFKPSYADDHRVTAGRARSTLAFHSRMPVLILILSFRSSPIVRFSLRARSERRGIGWLSRRLRASAKYFSDGSIHKLERENLNSINLNCIN